VGGKPEERGLESRKEVRLREGRADVGHARERCDAATVGWREGRKKDIEFALVDLRKEGQHQSEARSKHQRQNRNGRTQSQARSAQGNVSMTSFDGIGDGLKTAWTLGDDFLVSER
jgi:hypothetical protein